MTKSDVANLAACTLLEEILLHDRVKGEILMVNCQVSKTLHQTQSAADIIA